MLFKGKEINNDEVGRDLLEIMDEIYIEAKLANDNITMFDVTAIIGLWELFTEEQVEDTRIIYKGTDISGLMGDIE